MLPSLPVYVKALQSLRQVWRGGLKCFLPCDLHITLVLLVKKMKCFWSRSGNNDILTKCIYVFSPIVAVDVLNQLFTSTLICLISETKDSL